MSDTRTPTHVQVLRIKKLTGSNIIEVAAKHNLREIQAGHGAGSAHIDGTRSGSNQKLIGPSSAAEVAAQAKKLMQDAGITRLRKDAVLGLEIVFSLPPTADIDRMAFFDAALQWIDHVFSVPVLSAIAHNDEAAPHCHVLLLPLVSGRMNGSNLMGAKPRLKALQDDFHAKVGSRFGLSRQAPQRRLDATTRRELAEEIYRAMVKRPAHLADPNVKEHLLAALAQDPTQLATVLSLPVPNRRRRSKTFVEIMTAPCKPEKPIGFDS